MQTFESSSVVSKRNQLGDDQILDLSLHFHFREKNESRLAYHNTTCVRILTCLGVLM